jgi:hypothetical protein
MLHQLLRFSSVAPLIQELPAGTLLDVGSGSDGVAGWLPPAWRVTALDLTFAETVGPPRPGGSAARAVTGDARALPFPDASFDVVLALDLLEHVAPADRRGVIAELVRTARRRVIVAGPAGEGARAADLRLGAALRGRGHDPPEWLAEHEQHPFPTRGDIREQLEEHGRVRLMGDENLRWHEVLMRIEARRPGFHLSRAAARAIAAGLASDGPPRALSRVALRAVRGPRRGRAYRTIAVLDLTAPS